MVMSHGKRNTIPQKHVPYLICLTLSMLSANVCTMGLLSHSYKKPLDLGPPFLSTFLNLWFCPEFYERDNEIQDRVRIL